MSKSESDRAASKSAASDSADEKARRRRAERLLGGLLPDQTQDESAEGWGDREGSGSRDDEIKRDVPPHHGS